MLLYSFVPRFIYPDKPNLTIKLNDRFTVLFGLQTLRSTRSGTSTFSIIADGYWNFGWAGVVSVGFIVGLYWGIAASLWLPGHFGMSWLALALFAKYHTTEHLVGQIGSLPQEIIGISATAWVIAIASAMLSRSRRVSLSTRRHH